MPRCVLDLVARRSSPLQVRVCEGVAVRDVHQVEVVASGEREGQRRVALGLATPSDRVPAG